MKQSGTATYPLLLNDNTQIQDGFIEVMFKAIAGSEDRAAGIVWRVRDANNYYVVRANALEDNVVLYKTVEGVRSALDIVGRKGGYGVPADGGLASTSTSEVAVLGCSTTANSYSRSKIRPSATLEKWGCGQRPTA